MDGSNCAQETLYIRCFGHFDSLIWHDGRGSHPERRVPLDQYPRRRGGVSILWHDAERRLRPLRLFFRAHGDGDQSVFVRAAIEGVVREAIIVAVLTALMILLFLGSVRSTIIIAVSIPLSVLSSIVVLSAIGQTINTLTLGGLAHAGADDGGVHAARRCRSPQKSPRTWRRASRGHQVAQPLRALPARLRARLCPLAARLSRSAGGYSWRALCLRRRLSCLHRGVGRGTRPLARADFLPRCRCRVDVFAHHGADRNAHRGNRAADTRG